MDNLNLIAILVLPLLLTGLFLKPELILYYLILDTWLITRISDITFFFPWLSFNRIIIFLSLMTILVKRLSSHKEMPKSLTSSTTLLVTIYLLYCFYSYYKYRHHVDFKLLNNLVFYYLALFLLDTDFEQKFIDICRIAIIPVSLLSLTSLFSLAIDMDIAARIRSYAGNPNNSAFYVLLGLPFLFTYRHVLANHSKKIAVSLLIFIASLYVPLTLGRTVSVILFVFVTSYFMRGYISTKTILCLGGIFVIGMVVFSSHIVTFFDGLVRLPKSGGTQISKFDEDEMGAFTSGRSKAYKVAWKEFLQSPLEGTGYDGWRYRHRNYKGSSLHSAWLQSLNETGLIGTSLYVLIYGVSFYNLHKLRRIQKKQRGKLIFIDPIHICLVFFVLGGIFDNFGYWDRLFFLIVALSSTLNSYSDESEDRVGDTTRHSHSMVLAESHKVHHNHPLTSLRTL